MPIRRVGFQQIKQYAVQKFGADAAGKVMKEMTKSIRDLQRFENKGVSVESVLGIPCDYRMLYVLYHYVFYQIEADIIKTIDIYNEKEDFIWKLFGIKTTIEETENYWEE